MGAPRRTGRAGVSIQPSLQPGIKPLSDDLRAIKLVFQFNPAYSRESSRHRPHPVADEAGVSIQPSLQPGIKRAAPGRWPGADTRFNSTQPTAGNQAAIGHEARHAGHVSIQPSPQPGIKHADYEQTGEGEGFQFNPAHSRESSVRQSVSASSITEFQFNPAHSRESSMLDIGRPDSLEKFQFNPAHSRESRPPPQPVDGMGLFCGGARTSIIHGRKPGPGRATGAKCLILRARTGRGSVGHSGSAQGASVPTPALRP